VRAPALQAGGPQFESAAAHHCFQCFTAHIAPSPLACPHGCPHRGFSGATRPRDAAQVARKGKRPLLEAPERALEKSSVVVRSIGRLIKWWQQPHILMTGLSIGVAVGTAMSVYTGRIDFIGGPFVWAGCFIVLRRAWQ